MTAAPAADTAPTLALAQPAIAPMEARLVETLPTEAGWQFEPKWDGFRCVASRDGGQVDLRAKSGKPLTRYFPAKRIDGPYAAGERAMLKVKRLRTADCVVGGYRYQSGARQVGSLLLGLYDDKGLLDHVGFTSAITDAERPALTCRLEGLEEAPGFTGDAPGGPSRWSSERSGDWRPLRPELVVEVRYDHVTGRRFRHGTMLMRWRPDKAPGQCTFEQMQPELRPAKLVREVLER